MYPSKKLILALLAFASYCASPAAASAITITSNYNLVQVGRYGTFSSDLFTGMSIPSSHLLDATRGEYYSRNQISYTGSGNQVTLLNEFSQERDGQMDSFSVSLGKVRFTAVANSTFSLSGIYSASHVTTASHLYLRADFTDLTTSQWVNSEQTSEYTLNESFILGGGGGDSANVFIGSLTGSLIAGHNYEFSYAATTHALFGADGGATASGFVRLDIGGGAPSNAVPDSGTTLALLGLTLASLAALRLKFTCV